MLYQDLCFIDEEISTAQRFQQRMESARTLEDYEDSWKAFLDSLVKIDKKLEAALKNTPQYHPWNSRWKQKRREVPLIDYLMHARNATNHTVSQPYTIDKDTICINTTEGVYRISGFPPSLLGIHHNHQENSKTSASFSPTNMLLCPAIDRGQTYMPPTDTIKNPPHLLAINAINFFKELFLSAVDTFFMCSKHDCPDTTGTIIFNLQSPEIWPIIQTNVAQFDKNGLICSVFATPKNCLLIILRSPIFFKIEYLFPPKKREDGIIKVGISWENRDVSLSCNGELIISSPTSISQSSDIVQPILTIETI